MKDKHCANTDTGNNINGTDNSQPTVAAARDKDNAV